MTGLFFRCANPAAPTGGPRDSTAPKILSMLPMNFSTNFNAKKVVIQFDEYVQLKDMQKEIVIAPPMKRRPAFKVKGRSVEITFETELDSATTYKIDFGTALRDNNEGNILRNFSYIFSTGQYIDSLVMTGQLVNAQSGDTIINGIVYLFDKNSDSLDVDSTLFIGKPLSVARTDSNGVFIATNLRDLDYLVYGIGDKNNNAYYDAGEDVVAFADTTYNPADMSPFKLWYNSKREAVEASPQFQLRAFSERPRRRQNLAEMKRTERGVLKFFFAADSARVDTFKLLNYDSTLLFKEFVPTGDTMTVWIMKPDTLIGDSIQGSISYHVLSSLGEDSIATKKINMFSKRQKEDKRRGSEEKREGWFKLNSSVTSLKSPYEDIVFKFRRPIAEFNKELVLLEKGVEEVKKVRRGEERAETKDDDLKRQKVDFEFQKDSVTSLRWNLKSKWDINTKYFLTINENAFVDIIGEKSDSFGSKFSTMDPEKYGMVIFDIENSDTSVNYIVELVTPRDGKVVYVNKFAKVGVDTMDYISPGNYTIKVTRDVNRNGKWDTGWLLQRLLPETVAIYRDEKGLSVFEIKANWEQNIKINMDKLFKVSKNQELPLVLDSVTTVPDSLIVISDSVTTVPDSLIVK